MQNFYHHHHINRRCLDGIANVAADEGNSIRQIGLSDGFSRRLHPRGIDIDAGNTVATAGEHSADR